VRRTALLLIALAAVLQVGYAPAAGAREVHYDWLTAGEVSGFLKLQLLEDGGRVADFEFNDRGRGPQIHEVVRVGDDGIPVAVEISGRSYMGAPAEETFRVDSGQASWASTLESGTAPAGAFYSANDGTPEALAMLARALLRSPGRSLALLPAGSASIRTLGERQVNLETESRRVTLYAISGLDLTPRYVWLDQAQELFALTLGWMGLAPRGWGHVLEDLQKTQDQAEQGYHNDLAARLTNKLPANWLLRNVQVLDVANGTLLENRLVAVSDGRIVRVAEDTGLDLPVYGELQPPAAAGYRRPGPGADPGPVGHAHASLAVGRIAADRGRCDHCARPRQ